MAKSRKKAAKQQPPQKSYEWANEVQKAVTGLTADQVGAELERIESRDGGVTPKAVVDESRPADAVLHPVFEWNDPVAAEKYREHQARRLICSVRVVERSNGKASQPTVAFVSVVSKTTDKRAYVSTATAMSDEDYRNQVLADAKRAAQALQARFARFKELADVFKSAEESIEAMVA